MGDVVIFTYEGMRKENHIKVKGTDTLDFNFFVKLASSIFDSNYKYITDLRTQRITMIIKCKNRETKEFEQITTIGDLITEKYRDPNTKGVISEIYLRFPETYISPFRILSGSSASSKYGRANPSKMAIGYSITLIAGREVKMLPAPMINSDFTRWSILSSSDGNRVLDIIKRAYTDCEGNPNDETYKIIIENIRELMEIKTTEHLRRQHSETMVVNRKNRLDEVFNQKVVEIGRLIDKCSNFKEKISEELQVRRGRDSDKIAQAKHEALKEFLPSTALKRNFIFKITPNDTVPFNMKEIEVTAANLEELKTEIKKKIPILTEEDNIDISKAVSDGDDPVPFKRLDQIKDKENILIDISVQSGGYRETPKRKKRRDTRRKKRKNTRRKNTKRKNTKRKNTKRRNTKKR